MSSDPAKPTPDPPRTAERAALAEAIAARIEAEGQARAARDAAALAADAAESLRPAWLSAKSETIALRQSGLVGRNEVDALAAAAARETRLAEHVAAAKVTHQAQTAALEPIERELRRANAVATKAARAVLAAAAGPLVCDVFALREALVAKIGALTVIEPALDGFAGGQTLADVKAALARADGDDLAREARQHPAGDLWRAFAAALLIDPDARPPPG